ncbi:MAG TPA: DUF6801 domain-containing protein [Acidimicrobiales bacterium]|nr:DUF6801 domain-containing protein [Acidimicrobiales bacterium]
MSTTSRWVRASRWAVTGGVFASGLLFGLGTPAANASTAPRTVSATYSCSTVVLGSTHTFVSPIAISGKTPTSVAPGAKVSMTGFQAKVTIPSSLVSTAESYGVTYFNGNIKTWYVNATDSKNKSVNAAGTGITIPKTNLPKPAANVTITVPAAAKTIGTWTAGTTAGAMTFTDGGLIFTLNDNLGVALTVTCSPKPAATISKTTVT